MESMMKSFMTGQRVRLISDTNKIGTILSVRDYEVDKEVSLISQPCAVLYLDTPHTYGKPNQHMIIQLLDNLEIID